VTLGGLIDRLEMGGYVERRPDSTDRRAKRVVLTAKGARLLAEIQSVATEVNARMLGGISGAELSCVEDVLYRMKQRLIAMDAVPGTANRGLLSSTGARPVQKVLED
jgi:DNA-binding MarR family transcriptional regulator